MSNPAPPSTLCCVHPQSRIDSPEPPPRLPASIDGIFAAAALPEDHPHALKIRDRKPNVDSTILCSPSLASKIKSQFMRKSIKALRQEDAYDSDAHAMTSREVLEDVQVKEPTGVEPKPEPQDEGDRRHHRHHQRFGSVVPGSASRQGAENADLRISVLKSLEWLKPMIQKPSNLSDSDRGMDIVDLAMQVASCERHDSPFGPMFSADLSKTASAPNLPQLRVAVSTTELPRSKSDLDLGDQLKVPKLRQHTTFEKCLPLENDLEAPGSAAKADGKVIVDTSVPEIQKCDQASAREQLVGSSCQLTSVNKSRPDDIHLHNMDISQQLRSMSQLSGPVEDAQQGSSHPWNFHHREISDPLGSFGVCTVIESNLTSGLKNSAFSSWGRVRSPAASSVYSRPSSPPVAAPETTKFNNDRAIYGVSDNLEALFADWPLRPVPPTENLQSDLPAVLSCESANERRNKHSPLVPAHSQTESGTPSFMTASNKDNGSVKWLALPQTDTSMPSKSSSSTLTKGSKHSRFFERFSPPKRLVRKRQSMFKFLRSGSRKQQVRSVSTPVLATKSSKQSGDFDGPADDPALSAVQYELEDQSGKFASRSLSMSQVGRLQKLDNNFQRCPTMADRERSLSVVGNGRRRPSVANLQKLEEAMESDGKESSIIRRKLSRARPMKDVVNPLMANALEKHHQEKALFRSASKQRESLKSAPSEPFLKASESLANSSMLSAERVEGQSIADIKGGQTTPGPSRQVYGTNDLPSECRGKYDRKSSMLSKQPSFRRYSAVEPAAESRLSGSRKISTSLASWSRYPSHSRAQRCASAGSPDAVTTRDFAVEINPEDIRVTDEMESGSPKSVPTPKPQASLQKSRSLTFSGIKRYYSNLFHTSGFAGQNRRTSVVMGGKLEHPELEMIPLQQPIDHHPRSDPLGHLKEWVDEDTERIKAYVKEEGTKFQSYLQKEEEEVKGYVRKERGLFEEFLKKEESRFEKSAHEELNGLSDDGMHGSSHHKTPSRETPFREDDLFSSSFESGADQRKRKDTLVGPEEDVVGDRLPENCVMSLDGTASAPQEVIRSPPSQAEIWSDVYKECLDPRPSSAFADTRDQSETIALPSGDEIGRPAEPVSMLASMLQPVKPRSTEHVKQLDPTATIRRFPSVTVVDDRKGHWRSVSLISVKTSGSSKAEQEAVHELLERVSKSSLNGGRASDGHGNKLKVELTA